MDRIIFKPSTDFLLDYLQSVMAQNQGKSFLQLPVYSHKTFFPWQFLKSVRASSIVLLLWASYEKEHVISLANISSEQIVCTSGLAMALLSLMLPSLSFKRLLSFPHALDAVYSPKASSRFENKVGFTVFLFFFPIFLLFFRMCFFPSYWNRQNQKHATALSKTWSTKGTTQLHREPSLKLHFTS